ncbi:hypothetical protein KC721_02930 [Candidatus Woesebacteria bacterium]|nr:hypothetical protein [Candidatus Woesebacteria bacterium]
MLTSVIDSITSEYAVGSIEEMVEAAFWNVYISGREENIPMLPMLTYI